MIMTDIYIYILIIYHEYMLGQKTVMLFQWIQERCFPSETGVSGLACRGKGHVSHLGFFLGEFI